MKRWIIFLILLFSLILSSYASEIGFRSNDLLVTINYHPNETFEGTYYYNLLYRTQEPTDIKLYTSDDNPNGGNIYMSKYFTLSQNIFPNISNEQPFFSVHVKIPPGIVDPGLHIVHMGAVEAPKVKGGMVAVSAIEALFYINVPYNGIYLRYGLSADDVNQGTPMPVKISYSNLGLDPIKNMYFDLQLVGNNNTVLSDKKTDTVSVPGQSSGTIITNLSTDKVPPGDYTLNSTVYYDGKSYSRVIPVKIGELNIKILNQTNEIFSGKINEISVDILSEWANPVYSVFSEITIGGYPTIKTLTLDLKGFQNATLKGYFDATNVVPGIYDMVIKLHFGDKIVTKTAQISIKRPSILSMPDLELSATNILILIIIMIILMINIMLFIILVKKKDEHEKEKS